MHVDRNHTRSPFHRRSGFTLLELLVAMTILAIMAVTATAGLRLIAQAWAERSSDAAVLSDQARMSALARELLSRARSGVTGDEASIAIADLAEGERAFFAGTEDAVLFVTDGTVYESGRALYRHRLSIRPGVDGSTLVLASTPLALEGETDSAASGEPLTRNLLPVPEGSRFAYLERARDGEQRWQARWADGARLPRAVRLTDPRGTTLLLAQRVIALPAGCALSQAVSQDEAQADEAVADQNASLDGVDDQASPGDSVVADEAMSGDPAPLGDAADPRTAEPACTP